MYDCSLLNLETKLGVVTRLGWTTEGLLTDSRRGARGFLFSKTPTVATGHNRSSIQQILEALFPGGMPAVGMKLTTDFPSNAKFKNEWSHTSTRLHAFIP